MDVINVVSGAAPEVVATLLASGALATIGIIWRRMRPAGNSVAQARAIDLVPSDLRNKFTFDNMTARTDDDEAGLALIAHLIEHQVSKRIEVIGRGPNWVESRTARYVSAVAAALDRGVSYRRILVIDDDLPENGLTWLLLLERFIALPEHRGVIELYPIRAQRARDTSVQFQLLDHEILHRTNRAYGGSSPAASRTAHSLFARAPDPEVATYVSIFERYLTDQPRAPTHLELVHLVEDLLATIDRNDFRVAFYWRVALDVLRFLDNLSAPTLPPRGFDLVGSLTPFTFSYDAASRFSASQRARAGARPAAAIPFDRFDDAKAAFDAGAIDHLCVPTSNTRLAELTPPTLDASDLESLQRCPVSGHIDVDVSFVLAGTASTMAEGVRLATVGAARAQVEDQLSKRVRFLPPPAETVESNYHAAWLASQNPEILAITSPSAAGFFGLRVFKKLDSGVTTFTVFSRPN